MIRAANAVPWRFARLSALAVAICLSWASSGAAADGVKVDFDRQVRKILSDKCYKCHGPDEKERQGHIRLDTQDGALGKTEAGGLVIAPGKSSESVAFQRITATEPDKKMPPADSGKTLSVAEVELIRRWIDQGAEWKVHWAFVPPQRPDLPQFADESWVRNPIDRFVLSKLQNEGLAPSKPADKTTLIRRVTYDLTGLPPTPAEIDLFVNDSDPKAFEKVVDRLLESPRYGEHMSRYWLDVARYGDTHGLHLDNERSMWKYREWVINAFNKNKPYDQFTVEQIAGDLLPNATIDQQVATGFNRCNVTTGEGGSIDEEVRVRYAVDRTEAISTVFLGLTLGCSVCHDHKFDPVSQKEFYSLYAFYNNTADAAMDGNVLAPPPMMKVPGEGERNRLTEIDQQIGQTNKEIADQLAKVEYSEPATPQDLYSRRRQIILLEDGLPVGARNTGNPDWNFVKRPEHPVFSGEAADRLSGEGIIQNVLEGANPALVVGEGDKLFAYVYLDPANPPKTVMLQFNDGTTWDHRAFWGEDSIAWGAPGTGAHFAAGPLPKAGEWTRLEVDAAAVGLAPGMSVSGWACTQQGGTGYWDYGGIVTRSPQPGETFESLLAWEGYQRTLTKMNVPQNVQDVIKIETGQRNADQQKIVREYFLEHVCGKTRGTFDPLHQKLAALNKQRSEVENAIPVTLVMGDQQQKRDTFVLVRGAYDKPGEKVDLGVPSVLPPFPAEAPKNRLGLATWLVQRNHPLTARVAVNRFWQQYFGRGIVKTSEDFGTQGDRPSNQSLLDWLSVEFMDSGWNVKGLQKLIVMSQTYQQSSEVTPAQFERDPENAMLARGPRFRMDAEVIRDMCLSVSGLMVEKLGGKSVKPYQPDGLWEAVAFTSSNTNKYQRDTGEALYRRSLYTFWKRTCPPPMMLTFDAPSRENCTARRPRTNTPLQALALMNDEQFVEASRGFGQRILKEGGSDPDARLTWGFRLVTARSPRPDELEVLKQILAGHLGEFQANREAATKLLAVGESKRDESLDAAELAAWSMVANLLMNLDEAITKE